MKDKRNFLEKFLDRKIEFTFKQLGALLIFSLGLGALMSILSFELGVTLIILMILILCLKIPPYVITFKGVP